MSASPFSEFAQSLTEESAFTVLALAKQLQAAGKDIVELEIGDSPFDTPATAKAAGLQAIADNVSHYCPSLGLPEFRAAAAAMVQDEFQIPATAQNIATGPGAKVFEQFFCEAFLNPGDGVLVFSPHFPTYPPNIQRRGARMVVRPLKQEHAFRPQLSDIEDFLRHDPAPRAIFLNSPHNPTGGVTTEADCRAIRDLIIDTDVKVFSDEPYCHMAWQSPHFSIASLPGMLDRCVAAYTFSKSYSMSGWRLGFGVSSAEIVRMMGLMLNTSVSCTPPMVQLAGTAALQHDAAERGEAMSRFHRKVDLLTKRLNAIEGVRALEPAGTFYVFPDVSELCTRLQISSHGLALYLLQAADDDFGVACLGGECFGQAGAGHIRFSCAEPDERLEQAMDFFATAITRSERLSAFLADFPQYRRSDSESA